MVYVRAALALLFSLNVLSPAAAAGVDGGLPEARMTWRLSFGDAAQAVQTGYGLAVGYRGRDGGAVQQLLELDVSDRAALARLAGLPLFGRDYRANQAEGDALAESGPTPWYARKWVWWTAGSIAATAALAGGGGETTICTGVCNQGGSDGGPPTTVYTGSGDDPTGAYVGCAEGQCVMCPNGDVASDCSGYVGSLVAAAVARDVERDRWLDAGTGHMGDLIAR